MLDCANCSTTPGFGCLSGAWNSTGTLCPPGRYGEGFRDAGSGVCALCPAGRFGDRHGANQSSCTDACPAGFYGITPGLASSSCTGLCPPGNFCPVNTSTPLPCPAGRFGCSFRLTEPACAGSCAAGYYCPAGSKSNQQVRCGGALTDSRAAAFYCPEGSATPRRATPGESLSVDDLRAVQVTLGLTDSLTRYHHTGRFLLTLHTLHAYTERVRSLAKELNPGLLLCLRCVAGFYTVDSQGGYTSNVNVRTAQARCPIGHFCRDGVMVRCLVSRCAAPIAIAVLVSQVPTTLL
jgi:hypothetical protein